MLIVTFGCAVLYSLAIAAQTQHRFGVLDVPPVDRDRLGGLRRLTARCGRRRGRRRGRRSGRGPTARARGHHQGQGSQDPHGSPACEHHSISSSRACLGCMRARVRRCRQHGDRPAGLALTACFRFESFATDADDFDHHTEDARTRQGRFDAMRRVLRPGRDTPARQPVMQRRQKRARNFRYHVVHDEHGPGDAPTTTRRNDDRLHRGASGRVGPDRLEGHQRPAGRLDRDPPARGGRPREQGYQRSRRSRARSPLLEVIFNELESEWALEIVRGVERVAGRNDLAVVISEMQGQGTPGRGWFEGVLARRPMGVIAVFSDLTEAVARAAPRPRHPVRRGRPDGRAAPRHSVGRSRRTGTAASPRRDTSSPWATAGSV